MKILNFFLFFLYTTITIASNIEKNNFLKQRKEQEKNEHYNSRVVKPCNRLEKTLNPKQIEDLLQQNEEKEIRKIFVGNPRLQAALQYGCCKHKQKSYDRMAAMSPLGEYGKNSDLPIIINEPGFVSVVKPDNIPNLDLQRFQLSDFSLEDKGRNEINYQKEAKRIVHEIKFNTNNDHKESFDLNDFDMCEQEDN
ncbi:MAG: hypothetical protein ACXWL2_00425 [Candidatus Chromulinivorax sp.]